MSWVRLLVAVVVAVLLQTTVCRMGDLPLVEVDLLLTLALVYGLIAAAPHACIAAWIIGFVYDLNTAGAIGVHALAFGLTAWLLTRLREAANAQVWWVRVIVGFLAALPGQLLIPLHLRFIQGGNVASWWEVLVLAVQISLTAGLLAALLTMLPPLSPRRHARRPVPWARAGA